VQESHLKDRHAIAAIVLVLAITGLVMVASTKMVGAGGPQECRLLNRQLLWVALAVTFMFLFSRIDYRLLGLFSPFILVGTVLLLIAVLVIGFEHNGARRWIRFLGFGVQPSELAKFALVVFVSAWLSRDDDRPKSFRYGFLPVLIVAGLIGGLVLIEPDFGTAVLLVVVAMTIGLLAGIRVRYCMPLVVFAVPLLYHLVWMVQYRHDRLLAFLDPWKYYNGVGYQLCQSLVALGTGGVFGVGPGQSRQKLGFLPEAVHDFIFAILGEELGILGTMTVVVLFGAFVVFGMRVAFRARDRLGFLIASGVTLTIAFQALINVAVVTGSAPTKGISLPFVSFGGSSLFFLMCSVGVLLNVARRAEATEAAPESVPAED